MKAVYSLLFISSVLFFSSCKKSNEQPTPEYDYGPFNYGRISGISANGNIVIDLVQGTSNEVVRTTKGGPQIVAVGGGLILNGSGTVRLSVKDPLSISMNGYGGIKNTGPISMKSLYIGNQSSTIVLDSMIIDSTLSITLNNTGDCQVAGRANYLVVSVSNLPTFYGFGLLADSCLLNVTTLGQIQVNASQKLKGNSYGVGNIFYKGNPDISLQLTGGGKLIHQQ